MVLAWGELQSAMPGRLRPCANGECHLFLLDRSRGGTGRWCSMAECGNRMKARRHYGRTAGAAT
jgi:predicted RNA-binding Zn ribbon-like protein